MKRPAKESGPPPWANLSSQLGPLHSLCQFISAYRIMTYFGHFFFMFRFSLKCFHHILRVYKMIYRNNQRVRVVLAWVLFWAGSHSRTRYSKTNDKERWFFTTCMVGNSNPLQYICLENSKGGGACRLQSIPESWTQLSDFTFNFHFSSLKDWLKKQCCVCLVIQSCLTLCDPTDCSPPGSFCL